MGTRVPGSLLQPEEAQRLECQEAALDPNSALHRSLSVREQARIAFIRMDNDQRIRKSLLRKAQHHDGPYPVGAAVYFRRQQKRRGELPNHRWFGIARVIGHEGRGHGVWLRYGASTTLSLIHI